ncbi:MAG: hypothetical protein JJE04_02815 [Acidobacteriia bacterium]|nr:hypothetical protein [Terriglobia bacterium]
MSFELGPLSGPRFITGRRNRGKHDPARARISSAGRRKAARRETGTINASQLRAGMAITYEGQDYKVVAAEYHPGQGKRGGATHARLRNLATGTFWEHVTRTETPACAARPASLPASNPNGNWWVGQPPVKCQNVFRYSTRSFRSPSSRRRLLQEL